MIKFVKYKKQLEDYHNEELEFGIFFFFSKQASKGEERLWFDLFAFKLFIIRWWRLPEIEEWKILYSSWRRRRRRRWFRLNHYFFCRYFA